MSPKPEDEAVVRNGMEEASSEDVDDSSGREGDDLAKKGPSKIHNKDGKEEADADADADADVDADATFSVGEANEDSLHPNGFWQRQSKRVARSPCTHFWASMICTLILSGDVLIVGDFSVSANNGGWQSRGTLIADRQTQLMLVQAYADFLFDDDEDGVDDVWNDVINNVQPGWEDDGEEEEEEGEEGEARARRRRRLIGMETAMMKQQKLEAASSSSEWSWKEMMTPKADRIQLSGSLGSSSSSSISWMGGKFPRNREQPRPLQQQDATTTMDRNRNSNILRPLPFGLSDDLVRRLEQSSLAEGAVEGTGGILEGCDISYYVMSNLTQMEDHLWPVWRINPPSSPESASSSSSLDAAILLDLCIAETKTQTFLEEQGLCWNGGCKDPNKCLPPFSWVLYSRLVVAGGMTMTCQELSDAWRPVQDEQETQWRTCVSDMKSTYDPTITTLPDSCPTSGFDSPLVDAKFDASAHEAGGEGSYLKYTSSIFFTGNDFLQEVYDNIDSLDRASWSTKIYGSFGNQWEGLIDIHMDTMVTRDMTLAMGSSVIIVLAMFVHTKSPFITLIGLSQIMLSFPLSYFVYNLVMGLEFFPFLNFIGVFVLFALGSDDVFVAVDKWKNARLLHPHGSTELIAALALPDAAGAMFQTSFTTAIAFFSTAICPVAPIQMFSIFVGLLVMFDYLLNILLIFPALCIYDATIIRNKAKGQRPNCCITLNFCVTGNEEEVAEVQDDERRHPEHHHQHQHQHDDVQTPEKGNQKGEPKTTEQQHHDDVMIPSLIHRILNVYYDILHKFRWPLLVACCVALTFCIIFAARLTLPATSDVRVLSPDVHFEMSAVWRKELLYSALDGIRGSRADVIWGVLPADTGTLFDPASWSQLVLDEAFDPSSKEAQVYLAKYCTDLFDQEFASFVQSDYTCSMHEFDLWLQDQAASAEPEAIYTEHCANAAGLPVPPENFHACMIGFTKLVGDTTVLARNGIVTVMSYPFMSRVRYVDFQDILDKEWNLIESWMDQQTTMAPPGVNNFYFTSFDFWWYDTNGQMLKTAYGSAGIALAAAAGVVLIASRSLTLTFFSVFTISYVLTSVTATLVSLGWTLGFLESICFAILIGISVDFVIHFGHAYSSLPGDVSKEERTKYALIHMGPSILAGAFTTMASAIIMLFTVITFFQKFALILFFTVIQAWVGSFIVFLTLTDCLGPSRPTALVDSVVAKCTNGGTSEEADKILNEREGISFQREPSLDVSEVSV